MSTLKICKLKLLATDQLGAFASTRDPLKKYSKGNNSKPEVAISQCFVLQRAIGISNRP